MCGKQCHLLCDHKHMLINRDASRQFALVGLFCLRRITLKIWFLSVLHRTVHIVGACKCIYLIHIFVFRTMPTAVRPLPPMQECPRHWPGAKVAHLAYERISHWDAVCAHLFLLVVAKDESRTSSLIDLVYEARKRANHAVAGHTRINLLSVSNTKTSVLIVREMRANGVFGGTVTMISK